MGEITLTPVGVVRSSRMKPEDDRWDAELARVELDPAQFSAEALAGLADFSHVEIVFFMDRVDPGTAEKASRHPRNNANWPKIGIFRATREGQAEPHRNNDLQNCECRGIERARGKGWMRSMASPVSRLKPWVAEFGPRGSVRQPQWISELMRGYWRG